MPARIINLDLYSDLSKKVVYILEYLKPFIRIAFMVGIYFLLVSQDMLNEAMKITLGTIFGVNLLVFLMVKLHRNYIQLKVISYISILLCLSIFSVLVLSTGGINSEFFLAFMFYIALVPFFQLGYSTFEQIATCLVIIGSYNAVVYYAGIDDPAPLFIRNFFFGFLTLVTGISGKVMSFQNSKVEAMNGELMEKNYQMTNDLKMAQIVQETIIPKIFPESELLDFNGRYLPMDELGGDYYDVFRISDAKFGVVIADVSGHGVAAALVTIMAKMSFGVHSREERPPGDVVSQVNKELWNSIGEVDKYLTAFYGVVDIENNVLQYCNAGHNDIAILDRSGNIRTLASNGTVIGIDESLEYRTDTEKLEIGDRIILYTDGITEARNPAGDFLGEEKFHDLLKRYSDRHSRDMINSILADVEDFCQGAPVEDDRTILITGIGTRFGQTHVDFNIASAAPARQVRTRLDEALKNYKLENYDDALTILLELEKEYPDNFRILNLMGYVYYKLQRNDEALRIWNRALELNPGNANLEKNIRLLSTRKNTAPV